MRKERVWKVCVRRVLMGQTGVRLCVCEGDKMCVFRSAVAEWFLVSSFRNDVPR